MRIVVIFLLLGFVPSIMAITRCEMNGKVTYKKGRCPEYATTKYLVKGRYVEEKVLQQQAQENIERSEQAFKQQLSEQEKREEKLFQELEEQDKAERVYMSDESVHFQLKKAEDLDKKTEKNDYPDDVNKKVLEMERKIIEQRKALEQLQQQ